MMSLRAPSIRLLRYANAVGSPRSIAIERAIVHIRDDKQFTDSKRCVDLFAGAILGFQL